MQKAICWSLTLFCCRCNELKHEAECSWCVFMKGGPCYKSFTLWQKCVADVGD